MALCGGLRRVLGPSTAAVARQTQTVLRPRRAVVLLCARAFGQSAQTQHTSIHRRNTNASFSTQARTRPCSLARPALATQRRTLFSTPAITSYLELPQDYDDATGLPFRSSRLGMDGGDLTPEEVVQVFGRGMSVVAANRMLRILHGRRVAGTLDDPDPALRINTVRYPQVELDTALAYLRATTPVDEVVNAGLRAEDELAAIEAEQEEAELARVEAAAEAAAAEAKASVGVESELPAGETAVVPAAPAVPPAPEPMSSADKWKARLFRKEAPGDNVYGTGAFDRIRATNRAKNEKLQRQREAEQTARRIAQEKEWAALGVRTREVMQRDGSTRLEPVREPRPMSPALQKYAEAATSHLDAPPEMSRWQRLWPSYAFVLTLVGAGSVLVSTYGDAIDAWTAASLSPAATTVSALVAANVLFFVAWRIPPLWRFMNRFMIVVPATPRPISLLGAMFSHQNLSHMLANVVFLSFIGLRLHDEVGRAQFLEIYATSGLLAYLASMTNMVLRNNLHLTTLGASGAIYGIATAYFMLHKFEGFKIFGLPPDPFTGIQGLGFVGLMLGLNLLTLRSSAHSIDVVTHFAGMAAGAAFGDWLYVRKTEAAAAAAEGRQARPTADVFFSRLSTTKKDEAKTE